MGGVEVKTILVIAGALALAACGHDGGVAIETQFKPVYIDKVVSCPDRATYLALKKSRPTPLRSQAMPPTADVRNARTTAQLGVYEAQGGWGDRVEAALDRCQVSEGLTTTNK
jgi:hypothetical protein